MIFSQIHAATVLRDRILDQAWKNIKRGETK